MLSVYEFIRDHIDNQGVTNHNPIRSSVLAHQIILSKTIQAALLRNSERYTLDRSIPVCPSQLVRAQLVGIFLWRLLQITQIVKSETKVECDLANITIDTLKFNGCRPTFVNSKIRKQWNYFPGIIRGPIKAFVVSDTNQNLISA